MIYIIFIANLSVALLTFMFLILLKNRISKYNRISLYINKYTTDAKEIMNDIPISLQKLENQMMIEIAKANDIKTDIELNIKNADDLINNLKTQIDKLKLEKLSNDINMKTEEICILDLENKQEINFFKKSNENLKNQYRYENQIAL